MMSALALEKQGYNVDIYDTQSSYTRDLNGPADNH